MIFHLAHPCLTGISYLIISTCLQLYHINSSRCFFLLSQENCSCTKLQLILVAVLSLLHLQLRQSHPNTWHHELCSPLFILPNKKHFLLHIYVVTIKWSKFLSWFFTEYHGIKNLVWLPDTTFMLVWTKVWLCLENLSGIINILFF